MATGTPEHAVLLFESLFQRLNPTQVVIEDYVLYPWRASAQSWSQMFTPRLIGMVEFLCIKRNISLRKMNAGQHKAFMTDDKLKTWKMYQRGKKHANDAFRIGAYYLIFGRKNDLRNKRRETILRGEAREDR